MVDYVFFFFNFFINIIVLPERKKTKISTTSQDRRANLIHSTKSATNFIKSSTNGNIFEVKVHVLFLFSTMETTNKITVK